MGDVELFIEGNDNPEHGECWNKISQTLCDSYKNVQTEVVVSQRISDGFHTKCNELRITILRKAGYNGNYTS